MNTKNKDMIKGTRAFLRASGNPNDAIIAKYLPQGICAYLRFLESMSAAEKAVKLPDGFKIRHIDFEITEDADEKTRGIMAAANWVGEAVHQALMRDRLNEVLGKFKGALEDATGVKSVAYFGSDHEEEYNLRKATR